MAGAKGPRQGGLGLPSVVALHSGRYTKGWGGNGATTHTHTHTHTHRHKWTFVVPSDETIAGMVGMVGSPSFPSVPAMVAEVQAHLRPVSNGPPVP